mmetsp:Transcript_39978/g.132248  ORF Transcript_39978/g.132248 Transcript_39978/m.132248 type:complete len:231 (-) Transcript_39978:29-721(-)
MRLSDPPRAKPSLTRTSAGGPRSRRAPSGGALSPPPAASSTPSRSRTGATSPHGSSKCRPSGRAASRGCSGGARSPSTSTRRAAASPRAWPPRSAPHRCSALRHLEPGQAARRRRSGSPRRLPLATRLAEKRATPPPPPPPPRHCAALRASTGSCSSLKSRRRRPSCWTTRMLVMPTTQTLARGTIASPPGCESASALRASAGITADDLVEIAEMRLSLCVVMCMFLTLL